jgi:hypothetical protein
MSQARSVLDNGDLVARAVDEPRRGVVHVLDGIARLVCRLVPTDAPLQLQVADRRGEHGCGHERRARVVEVQNLGAARRLAPSADKIDRHGVFSHRSASSSDVAGLA